MHTTAVPPLGSTGGTGARGEDSISLGVNNSDWLGRGVAVFRRATCLELKGRLAVRATGVQSSIGLKFISNWSCVILKKRIPDFLCV